MQSPVSGGPEPIAVRAFKVIGSAMGQLRAGVKSALKVALAYNRWVVRGENLYIRALCEAVEDCRSLLDVGCGARPLSMRIGGGHEKYLCDSHRGSLKADGMIGVPRVVGDVRLLPFQERSVDAVFFLQVLEHIEKEEGRIVLAGLESIARKVVVLSTPNGFVKQGEIAGNPFQTHRSGWSVNELEALGYKVSGYEGFRIFKIPGTSVNRRPSIVFSLLTGMGFLSGVLRRHPSLAFQVLAWKTLDRPSPAEITA